MANVENMSSNVQAWRTPVTDPSGAKIKSLFTVTHTCGCAGAEVHIPATAATAAATTMERRIEGHRSE
jgi:hypothetical protein